MKTIDNKIEKILTKYKDKVIVATHHYQNREIVKFANYVGDSYKLAVDCSKSNADFIVLCGVYFMAESAAILAKKNQFVIIPDRTAGCPMADMITGDNAEMIIKKISQLTKKNCAPIVYMNSYIDSKAVCGKYDGAVCTSSNAKKIIKYYLKKKRPIFFYPDFHLGNNCANQLNISKNQIAIVNQDLSIDYTGKIENIKIFLYDGNCHVHQQFKVNDVENIRKKYKDINIIVHPECSSDVVDLADYNGSTDYIYDKIKNADKNSIWGIGTEYNFISRIIETNNDKKILYLKEVPCIDMEKITKEKLLDALENIDGFINNKNSLNAVRVNENLKKSAIKSLKKMMYIVEKNYENL